jgi:hypothetical protein
MMKRILWLVRKHRYHEYQYVKARWDRDTWYEGSIIKPNKELGIMRDLGSHLEWANLKDALEIVVLRQAEESFTEIDIAKDRQERQVRLERKFRVIQHILCLCGRHRWTKWQPGPTFGDWPLEIRRCIACGESQERREMPHE